MTVQIVDNKGRVFNSSFRKPRTLQLDQWLITRKRVHRFILVLNIGVSAAILTFEVPEGSRGDFNCLRHLK